MSGLHCVSHVFPVSFASVRQDAAVVGQDGAGVWCVGPLLGSTVVKLVCVVDRGKGVRTANSRGRADSGAATDSLT